MDAPTTTRSDEDEALTEDAPEEASSRPEAPTAPAAPGGDQGTTDDGEGDGPPPLPPLLETGASLTTTAASGIYAATGTAGLVAAAGIAAVAGVAYGVKSSRRRSGGRAGATGSTGAGKAGRFFSGPGGTSAGRDRSAAGARSPGGPGRHRAASGGAGRGDKAGAARTGALGRRARDGAGPSRASGAAGRSGGSAGASRAPGAARRTGERAEASGGARGGALRGSGASGRRGTRGGSLFGSSRRSGSGSSGRGAGAGSLFGLGRSRSRGSSRRPGTGGGKESGSSPRPLPLKLKGASRLARGIGRMWRNPRTRRVRARARLGWRRARVRIRSRSDRIAAHLRKRKWALRARGWWEAVRDLARRWWGSLVGRAADARFGHLRGWQLRVAAAAIGALGARDRAAKAKPRILVGRIVGDRAPLPGSDHDDDGPLALAGRALEAITTGGEPLPAEVQRAVDAAEELKAALSDMTKHRVGMLTFEEGLKQLPSVLHNVADGFSAMASTAEEEQPLDPAVTEYFSTIADATTGAAEVAEELPGLFRAAHEVELDRLENPRPGEEAWDFSRQQELD